MDSLLLFLLIPLLGCVALLPRWRGPAAARVVIVAFALATLQAGTGSLAPDTMLLWVRQGPSERLFVSLSTGIALGGLGLWSRRGRWWYLTAAPIGAGLLLVFGSQLQLMPLLLGAVLGAMPLLVGSLAPRVEALAPTSDSGPRQWTDVALSVLALVAVASRSLALIAATPLLLVVGPARRASPQRSVFPIGAALILIALMLYSMSLASEPIAVLTSMGFLLPVGGAVERVIGAAVLAAAILMVAPWPLHRFGAGIMLVPAAAILVYHVAGSIAPLGIAGWLPLAAMVLVPSAIAAAWRGHWANALGSAAILTVPRPGWPGLVLLLLSVASLLVLSAGNPRSLNRISFPKGVLEAVFLAVAMALTAAAVLVHEVVLGALLAAGFATAAARPIRHLPAP